MTTKKQLAVSVCAGFTLLVLSIIFTAAASRQFWAEGPDTYLAKRIGWSWMWPFPAFSFLSYGALALPIVANAVIVFAILRLYAIWQKKKA